MLAGPVSGPAGHVERDRLDARRLGDDARRRRASCHVSRPSTAVPATGRRSCGSRSASQKPGSSALEQTQAAHPLGALPEVEVRDEQARRAAVLRLERLAVVAERDPRLAARDVLERQVGRVAAVAERDDVLGRRSRRRRAACRPRRPAQTVSSFDQLVTQWMSTVIVFASAARGTPPTSSGAARRPRRRSRSPTARAACAASARRREPGSHSSRTGPAAPGRSAVVAAAAETAGDDGAHASRSLAEGATGTPSPVFWNVISNERFSTRSMADER